MAGLFALVLILTSLLGRLVAGNGSPVFLSRPDIRAPSFTVRTIDQARVQDGYIFFTPAHGDFSQSLFIFSNQGSLVWSGHGLDKHSHVPHNFYKCTYEGAGHLCFISFCGIEGMPAEETSYGSIVNNNYHEVRVLRPGGQYNGSNLRQDLHEFNVIDGGASFLSTSYYTLKQPAKLNHCDGTPTVDWITTGFFTDTSTDRAGTVIFQWNALDYVNVHDTFVCPGQYRIRNGSSVHSGFDYFHINSVDKNEDGDYLVSGRHVSTVYKIAGNHSPSGKRPGEVIWRLAGKRNTFRHMESEVPMDGELNFTFQHHARWRPGGIHLWDNANNGEMISSGKTSSGMGIDIHEGNQTATLAFLMLPPVAALDVSQGSHQVLPNGNHFCGMGSVNELYERTPDGALAFDAVFGENGKSASYRAFKYSWTGAPDVAELALFPYAHNCSGPTAFHVSWNGATEVYAYRFFGGAHPDGPFELAGHTPKDWHFETTSECDHFCAYAYAVAVDAQGKVLGRTAPVPTFIPGSSIVEYCNERRCGLDVNYEYAPQTPCHPQYHGHNIPM